ncbi:MAG: primase, partial [Acidobacteriota bacterium]|nr:primase [Acidobacteriota bacterium]
RMAADFFQVDEKNLKLKFKDKPVANTLNGESDAAARGLDITPAERIFLESIVAMPELIEHLGGGLDNELLSLLPGKNIIRLLLSHYNPRAKQIEDYGKISAELNASERVELRNIFNSSEHVEKDKKQLERNIETSVDTFINMLNMQRFKQINQRIKIAERENNMPEALRLMAEKSKHIKSKYNFSIDMTANKYTGGAVERPQQR